ncbi:MAG TPA: S9 family peptidase [Vicinamibacteria bacterium]|nr:S9 family peptidase [Vicinamibacteria bacterium]
MQRRPLVALSFALLAVSSAAAERRRFGLDDVLRLREVSDPQLAPDGAWVAYVVEGADLEEDAQVSQIWMTSWDGRQHLQLTSGKHGGEHPRFSPDGRSLAFLSARGEDEDAPDQVWILPLAGGEARQLTELDGEVEGFEWSPDGKRMVLVVHDADPEALRKKERKGETKGRDKTARPIVVDRYQFKWDGEGYLGGRRRRLQLVDVESRKVEMLSSGANDDVSPAWSSDGRAVAFASKRGGDPDRHWNWDVYVVEARPGAEARPITSFQGADAGGWGPLAAEGAGPVFSPDGRSIAYLRSADASFERLFYGTPLLAVSPAGGGEPALLTAALDRQVQRPRWSPDGRHVYVTLEDDRSVQLARVPSAGGAPERLTEKGAVVTDFAVGRDGRVALAVTRGSEPAEVFALEDRTLRPLSRQNAPWLDELDLATVEELDARSSDGTPIGAMLTKPAGFEAGRRYPLLLFVHGGPQAQDQHEFDVLAQAFAGAGYLVVQPNYRGSTGRGYDFARAILAEWGNKEVKDVLAAVDAVVAQGLADPGRLGVLGWSYGGMMTNYTIASDGRFKAAASGASIANQITGYGTDQYVTQYENELGLPWKGVERYMATSYPFFHADRIRTPTLFMCGEKDFNVPLVNSEQMYQALKSLGVDTQLVIYPGQHHGLSKPSYRRDRVERYLAWFRKHLGL